MSPPAERRGHHVGVDSEEGSRRRLVQLVARYTVWSTLVLLVAVPVAVAAPPAHRTAIVRLAAALIAGLLLLDLIRRARTSHESQPSSAFEAALRPARPPGGVDRHFKEIQDEVRAGAASETYFGRVLWPRLLALADALPGRPTLGPPVRSSGRQLLRRGPSIAQIRRLVGELEDGA